MAGGEAKGGRRAACKGHRALAAALMMTTGLGAMATGVTPALAQSDARSFDIPAQPLATALTMFGQQSSLQVSAQAPLVEGKTSSAVRGDLPPLEALSQMLAGTGLSFRVSGSTVTLRPAPQASDGGGDGAITLGPVRVQGEGGGRGGSRAGTPRPPADTRGTYTVPVTGSATKLDLAIKDTPQVVNIITRQRIEDQNLVQVADVMNQAPGITTVQQGVPGMGQIDYWSRGFPVTNVMIDGVVTQAAGNGNFVLWSVLDTAVFDRVEFVQGSSGLGSGMGDPSASVNFIRKRPTETFQGEGFISYGSWDRLRATVDLGGPLDKSGTLRARVVGAHQTGGTWQDRVDVRNDTAYGIVEFDPTPDLMLTAGLTWNKGRVDDAATFGINPIFLTQHERSYNPATQWSFAEVEMLNPFAKVEWRFADNWRLNASYMYSRVKQQRLVGVLGQLIYDEEEDSADYNWARLRGNGAIHNADVSVSGKFKLFGQENDIVAGFNGYRGYIDSYSSYMAPATSIEGYSQLMISNWHNGNAPYPTAGPEYIIPPGLLPTYPYGMPNYSTYQPLFREDMVFGGVRYGDAVPPDRIREEQYAPYFALRLRPIERLQLILGARQDHWRRWFQNYSLDTNATAAAGTWVVIKGTASIYGSTPVRDLESYDIKAKGRITPYAGLIFDVTDAITAYASYTGISKANFQDGNNLLGQKSWPRDRNGDSLPLITGNSMEIGVKAGFFNNRLNVQLIGFRMVQKNLPVEDLDALNPDGTRIRFFDPLLVKDVYAQRPDEDGIISKGIEFNISGQIADRINLAIGYSYLDLGWGGEVPDNQAEVPYYENICETIAVGGNSSSTGLRRFQCPKHSIKAFGTWRATDNLTLGGGVNWKSRTGTFCANSIGIQTPCGGQGILFEQSSFAVVDLTARYRLSDNFTIGAYLGNVFDKKYLTTQDRFSGYYGTPRNITVSLTGRF